MSEFENKILIMARNKKPDEFIDEWNKYPLPEAQKGPLFSKIGDILYVNNYITLALSSWNKALEHYERDGNQDEEANCCTNLGATYLNRDPGKAIEYLKKALLVWKLRNYERREADCYIKLSTAYIYLGEPQEAIEWLVIALAKAKKIQDTLLEVDSYGNFGIAYDNFGDYKKAIEYQKMVLAKIKEIPDTYQKEVESGCYLNLGLVYIHLGDYGKAIDYLENASVIKKEILDNLGESRCYTNLGLAYYCLGDYVAAIRFQKMALAIKRSISDRQGESSCYTNLGYAYSDLNDYWMAIEYLEMALIIAKEIKNRSIESKCYANLGYTYNNQGDYSKAIEYIKKALTIKKELHDKSGESRCYENLGIAFWSLNDYWMAIEYLEMALIIAKEIGEIDVERGINFILGSIYQNFDDTLAYKYCERSIELSEIMGGGLVEEEQKLGSYAKASNAYQLMIPLCIKMGRQKEAFNYAERGKSRAFLDLLTTTEIKPSTEMTDDLKGLLFQEESQLARLREIQTRHIRKIITLVEPGEVEKVIENLNQIYGEIEKIDPEYVFMRRGKPLSLEGVQEMFQENRRGSTVLIEYFTTNDAIFIFVVSSKRELCVETVPINEEELLTCLKNMRGQVGDDSALKEYILEGANRHRSVAVDLSFTKDVKNTWNELSSLLIEPISKHIDEGDLIYFVPHGLLHYIPLHALSLGSEPLIKSHPVAYAPSASLIRFCQKKGSGELVSCAAFGVDFEDEAEQVAKLFDTEPYTRIHATREDVLSNCNGKDIIHFACHGFFNEYDPLASGLKLFGGDLIAREIFGMRINSELVALSACQTGLSQRSSGDDLVGLTRAFIYAGGASVMVSLWSVWSESTKELMLEFYRLLKEGKDKATALQEAQVKIMGNRKYSEPYFWAPFIMVGDWK